jgi:hypothetical protein
MEAHMIKEAPVLLIDLIGGIVGFVVALGWWKVSGRTVDRDSTIFIAKIFAGITLFGMVLAFIM